MVLVDICLSRWIRNFLLGRKEQVVLNGCSSAWSTLLLNAGKITYSFNVMLTDFWNGLMCTNSNLIIPPVYIYNTQLPPLVVLKILDLTFQGA